MEEEESVGGLRGGKDGKVCCHRGSSKERDSERGKPVVRDHCCTEASHSKMVTGDLRRAISMVWCQIAGALGEA